MATPAKVLVVEDESELREILLYNLTREGFVAIGCSDGCEGLRLAQRDRPDVVLLDLMLPDLDGWQVCRRLRDAHPTAGLHVIMVSARDGEDDILRGLELGADDYIRKPFRVKEIIARIRAVLRRTPITATDDTAETLRFPPLSLDAAAHEVHLEGELINLTATEYRLLHFLMSQPERIFTRPQLLQQVSEPRASLSGLNIDVHIRSLRGKLGDHAALIEPARGVGYRFSPPAVPSEKI